MKTFTLNKKSWHFWLASRTRNFHRRYVSETDICTYTKAVAAGALSLLAMTLFFTILGGCGAFVLYVLGLAIYWLGSGLPSQPSAEVQCGVGILIAIAIAALIVAYVKFKAHRRAFQRAEPPKPGFLELAYASFKGKMCVKIKLKD